MAKSITLKYALGDLVMLRTDRERATRVVTRITLSEAGVEYGLRCGPAETTSHSALEIEPLMETRSPGFRLKDPKRHNNPNRK